MHSGPGGAPRRRFESIGRRGQRRPRSEALGPTPCQTVALHRSRPADPKTEHSQSYFYVLQSKPCQVSEQSWVQPPRTQETARHLQARGSDQMKSGGGGGCGVVGICWPAAPHPCNTHPSLARSVRDRGGQNARVRIAILFHARIFPPTKRKSTWAFASTYHHGGHGRQLHSHVGPDRRPRGD